MAKYEQRLKGNFNELLNWLHKDITNGSSSASYEDGSDIELGDSRVAVRVYERYSLAGGNRVSLNITITGTGEETFLKVCRDSVENYIHKQ
ncbi:DUF6054 family protein [Anaeromicropila populeti]|uniref:Uncharacterized protein n=1 Tax=Anaeromicropila populeti TaxID=37658 RepID=A0A1I6LKH2_9FIRM|nr:DUF6054 family protein [Anaeromicropila populeti]SFS03974.1 hypothetical protein SAMN05661086_03360 [Anaeromicropila populeti]